MVYYALARDEIKLNTKSTHNINVYENRVLLISFFPHDDSFFVSEN